MNKSIYKFDHIEDIKKFIVGGNAIITLESKRTGRWFTYKIKTSKKIENSPFFVSVLTGTDNENSYTYMGIILEKDRKLTFKRTAKSRITEDALSYKAFSFFFGLLNNNKIHPEMGVYHVGRCSVCGKVLTTVDSLKSGIGPYCKGRNKD
jgi:hypothetical protein